MFALASLGLKIKFSYYMCPRVVVSKVLSPHHGPFRVGHNPKPTWTLFKGLFCFWDYSS